MIIEQLISPTVPILTSADTGSRALFLMEESNFAQLPLIIEEQYVALIQENDVLDWHTPETLLSAADFHNYRPAVFASGHPYEAMRIAYQQNLAVLPVVDNENKYVGSVTRETLFKYISENSGLDNPGAIIVLEVQPLNYTLYEIARICENEDVSIISVQVITNALGNFEVTIKTNRTDLQAVISSFERHKYSVKDVFGEKANTEDMMDRYKLLMNFINM